MHAVIAEAASIELTASFALLAKKPAPLIAILISQMLLNKLSQMGSFACPKVDN